MGDMQVKMCRMYKVLGAVPERESGEDWSLSGALDLETSGNFEEVVWSLWCDRISQTELRYTLLLVTRFSIIPELEEPARLYFTGEEHRPVMNNVYLAEAEPAERRIERAGRRIADGLSWCIGDYCRLTAISGFETRLEGHNQWKNHHHRWNTTPTQFAPARRSASLREIEAEFRSYYGIEEEVGTEIQHLEDSLDSSVSEAQRLIFAADRVRPQNPHAAVVMAAASAETGALEALREKGCDEDWVDGTKNGPGNHKILDEFLPKYGLFPEPDQREEVHTEIVDSLAAGFSIRGSVMHGNPCVDISGEKIKTHTAARRWVQRFVGAVRRFLYWLDYSCGEKWAEEKARAKLPPVNDRLEPHELRDMWLEQNEQLN
jgi:hypothetical protein